MILLTEFDTFVATPRKPKEIGVEVKYVLFVILALPMLCSGQERDSRPAPTAVMGSSI